MSDFITLWSSRLYDRPIQWNKELTKIMDAMLLMSRCIQVCLKHSNWDLNDPRLHIFLKTWHRFGDKKMIFDKFLDRLLRHRTLNTFEQIRLTVFLEDQGSLFHCPEVGLFTRNNRPRGRILYDLVFLMRNTIGVMMTDNPVLMQNRNMHIEDFLINFCAIQHFIRFCIHGPAAVHFLEDHNVAVIRYLTYRHFYLKVPEFEMDYHIDEPVEVLDLRALYTFRILDII